MPASSHAAEPCPIGGQLNAARMSASFDQGPGNAALDVGEFEKPGVPNMRPG